MFSKVISIVWLQEILALLLLLLHILRLADQVFFRLSRISFLFQLCPEQGLASFSTLNQIPHDLPISTSVNQSLVIPFDLFASDNSFPTLTKLSSST